MKMQGWELKERVDRLVETHGDSVWINADIDFRDAPSGGVYVMLNEEEL
jgi:hypothetical protein